MGTDVGSFRAAMPRGRRGGRAAAFGLVAVLLAGCAGRSLVLHVRLAPDSVAPARSAEPPTTYDAAIEAISAIIIGDLGLPLPAEFTVFVYPDRAAYAAGLRGVGQMPARRASEIAAYSVGLGQAGHLFLNDGALRRGRPHAWLVVLAHELTHVAQYELSAGRRGSSEQWLREGLADWVACQVLERLGQTRLSDEREAAMRAVGEDLSRLDAVPLDLVDLGRPRGWEARHLQTGDGLTYRLAFLMTAELIRRHGLPALVGYFGMFRTSDDRFGNFRRAFGQSLQEFEQDTIARLRRELQAAPAAPSGPPPTEPSR